MFSILFSNMDWARFAAISRGKTGKSPSLHRIRRIYLYFQESASVLREQNIDEDRCLDNIMSFDLDSE